MSKKISELNLTNSVSDGSSIPIVVNGTTMRVTAKVLKEMMKADPGKDGVSPTINISSITGGTRVTITDVNGTKSFDIKDGTSGSGGGVSSWDDLTDKPFGKEIITLLDNKRITTSEIDGLPVGTFELSDPLIYGQEYTVTYNGTQYVRTGEISDIIAETHVVIGNLSFINGPDTGEPFCIVQSDSMTGVVVLDGSTSVTLTIIGPKFTTIDPNYLPPTPSSVRFYFEISASETMYMYKDKALTEGVRTRELRECVLKNQMIILEDVNGDTHYALIASDYAYYGRVCVLGGFNLHDFITVHCIGD